MAKGDRGDVQKAVTQGTDYATSNLRNTQGVVNRQNLGFEQNYNRGVNNNLNDYDSMMNQYRSYLSGGPMGGQQPTSGAGNLYPRTAQAPAPGQSLVGGPHATNPNNASGIGTAVPRDAPPMGAPVGMTGSAPQGGQPGQMSAQQFIANYQAQNPEGHKQGKAGILKALQDAGYDASDYLYNGVSSGNEINLGGEKYKVLGGEGGPGSYWYQAGMDDSPGGGGGGLMNPLSGYSGFAQTGGFSPQDISNIRARAIAPIRGIYSAANADVDRQRKLQKGFSPNYTASKAKMAREQAYALSDKTTDAEAMIAGLVQSGKLAGLGGLQSGMLGAMQGQTGLYGTTPALASTFGNQVLGSTGQMLQGNQLANDIARLKMGGAQAVAQTPSNFNQVLGNISQILGIGGQVAGAVSGLGRLGRAPFGGGNTGIGRDYGVGSEPRYGG